MGMYLFESNDHEVVKRAAMFFNLVRKFDVFLLVGLVFCVMLLMEFPSIFDN